MRKCQSGQIYKTQTISLAHKIIPDIQDNNANKTSSFDPLLS